ncbi:hypothetical protein ACN38_g2022 [Penicillium nordicum]|uniref:Uncharacterized protein n=1 Tax=Penicillium nordicum TaxID=229535 RepID=A0A0M8P7N6_9EURO|nr:hypothetical protein ACN38_g2022 [Penicillium nordicum]
MADCCPDNFSDLATIIILVPASREDRGDTCRVLAPNPDISPYQYIACEIDSESTIKHRARAQLNIAGLDNPDLNDRGRRRSKEQRAAKRHNSQILELFWRHARRAAGRVDPVL